MIAGSHSQSPPCMGGWCRIRNNCAAYIAPVTRQNASERLCSKGSDGDAWRPIVARKIKVQESSK